MQYFVAIEHHIIGKSIIKAQFSVIETYLHVLNMKTAHAQLHLSRVKLGLHTCPSGILNNLMFFNSGSSRGNGKCSSFIFIPELIKLS